MLPASSSSNDVTVRGSSSTSTAAGNAGGKYGAACVGCRKRKQRCDAKLPACSRCQRMKENCVYESVRAQLSTHVVPTIKETYRFLRSLAALDSNDTSVDVPQLVRDFLSRTDVPSFVDETSPRSRQQQEQDDGSGGTNQPVNATRGDDVGSTSRAGKQSADRATVFRRESEYHERSERQLERSQVQSRDNEELGEAEVDELLMHMSLADDGQNAHFGVTSFVWQTPSAAVVEKLQARASKKADHSAMRGSNSAEIARMEEHDGGTSVISPPRETMQGVWATEDVVYSGEEEIEMGVLKANSGMLDSWMALAYHKLQLDNGEAQAEIMMHLLKTYCCWVNPHHCVLYPPVFYRDMGLGGQYFNHFLLYVICATATRYSDVHLQADNGDGTRTPALNSGAEFLAKAKFLLAAEMDKPSSIPTIQGLIILGVGECSKGNLSQGWQYTGMAFRAMRDLGIHLDCNRLPIFGFGTLSAEDRELRRRLFWSAFTWDKIISLALGRTPTFNAWQNVSPGMIVDDTEDDNEWIPHFGDQNSMLQMMSYPVQKSYITSNTRHFIKLCEIVQKIIMRLYDGRPRRLRNLAFVQAMKEKLDEWFALLPSYLKLDAASGGTQLPAFCPPPHIFSTNALYRAAFILLYRTFLPHAWPVRLKATPEIAHEASETCTRMSEELHHMFLLYHKTFSSRNMTYTTLWSMYSAATINALDFQSEDPQISAQASARLVFSIHVLERGSLQCPGIKRSVQVIKERLRTPAPRQPKRPREDYEVPTFTANATAQGSRLLTSSDDSPQRHQRQTIGLRSVGNEAGDAAGESSHDPFEHAPGPFNSGTSVDQAGIESHGQQQPYEPITSGRLETSNTYDDALLDGLFSGLDGTEGHAFGGGNGSDILQSMMAMPSANTISPLTWGEWPASGTAWRY